MEFLSFLATFIVLRLSLCRTTFAVVDTIRTSQHMGDNTSLVSRNEFFELGFFSPGNPMNRYLGIWNRNIPVDNIVWVANRCKPINGSSGSLTIDDTGNLVLYGQNKSVVIWSTNSSEQAEQPLVQLLDNGNLVLRDEKDENGENYLWESFDYPTDTMIPGMRLGWDLRSPGLNRRLSSWKSSDDPCDGDISYGIELDEQHHRYPQLMIRNGSEKLYRQGPWFGKRSIGYAYPMTEELVYNDDEVYYYINNSGLTTTNTSRIILDQIASLRLREDGEDEYARNADILPKDKCDEYGICGANSECVMKNFTTAVCQCLKGFQPKKKGEWNSTSWSEGCVRKSPPSCDDEEKDVFFRLSGLKVPDTQNTWVNKSLNVEECKAKCMRNCSCTAYSNLSVSVDGSGCVFWFGDLFDIQKLSSGGEDLYIRISASELAPAPEPEANNGETERPVGDRKFKMERVVIVMAVLGLAFGFIIIGFYIRRWRFLRNERIKSQDDDLELPLFDLQTIRTATNNFAENNKLGEGGFGPVYKGMLEGGQEIAVKSLSMCSGQGSNEFKNEIKLIAKVQHRNLVKIIGYSIHKEMKLLIYEYMPNKSLDYFIFDERQSKLLEWPKRFQIICGIAKGLLYLHHDSRLRIIHRDLKASNVLLDENMNPKISDFGLARTFGGDQMEGNTKNVVGTYGYMAPEYASEGLFSIKSDVFSFGTLMLEIVSGKKSRGLYDENKGLNLIGLAWTLTKEGKQFDLIDNCLLKDLHDNMEEALRCIHIGLLCVQQKPIDRPNMSSIIFMLSGEKVLPEVKQPAYFTYTDLWERAHPSSANIPSCNMSITTIEAR